MSRPGCLLITVSGLLFAAGVAYMAGDRLIALGFGTVAIGIIAAVSVEIGRAATTLPERPKTRQPAPKTPQKTKRQREDVTRPTHPMCKCESWRGSDEGADLELWVLPDDTPDGLS